MTRHMMGFFAGRPGGGRRWRRAVGEPLARGADPGPVLDALVELAAEIAAAPTTREGRAQQAEPFRQAMRLRAPYNA
jgi:hypothetical protein